jgi:hypothetical protein
MADLFARSDPTKAKAKGSLGDLATALVMWVTSFEDRFSLLDMPTLHAYGNIEQVYLDLLKKARRIDTIGQGDWPLYLRCVTIPLSDSVFVERRGQVNSLAASKLAKELTVNLEALAQYPSLWVPSDHAG